MANAPPRGLSAVGSHLLSLQAIAQQRQQQLWQPLHHQRGFQQLHGVPR
jgi:hypothetical protein